MADPTNAPAPPAVKTPATTATYGRALGVAGTTVIGIPTLVELIDYVAAATHLNPVPTSSQEAAAAALVIGGFNFLIALFIRGRAGIAAIVEGD